MSALVRNHFLDKIKLVAAFFVISLHVGFFEELGGNYGELVRLSGRWAVPFFFMVTGFFLARKAELNVLPQIYRIITIALLASLIFLPYGFLQSKLSIIQYLHELLSFKFVFTGTYFHLWYLSSMILALLLFPFVLLNFGEKATIFIAFIFFLLYYVSDAFGKKIPYLPSLEFTRHLISFSFLAFGYFFSTKNVGRKFSNKSAFFFLL